MKGHLMGIKFLIRLNSLSLLGIRKIGQWIQVAEIQGKHNAKAPSWRQGDCGEQCSGHFVRPWAHLAITQNLIASM